MVDYNANGLKGGCIDSSNEGDTVVVDDEQWIIGRVGTEYVEVYRRGGAQQIVPIDDVSFAGGEGEW